MTVTHSDRAQRVLDRCRQIADCSEVPGEITRTFLSWPMHDVHALLRGWMESAGMSVSIDAIGNLRGLWPGIAADSPRLIIASHLDTVPNAGAFDGPLGVVLGLALVEELRNARLPFAIEVIGFSEEEGVRFNTPFLGSLALTGKLDKAMLGLEDAHGMTLAEAIRDFGLDPASIPAAALSPRALAYLEFHIEQGPVLESDHQPLGLVAAIAGQSRYLVHFTGKANHAGTTPMRLRHDAMAAAAEWIVAVERIASEHDGLVATVGRVETRPGAGNVIAGDVFASLDVRHADDAQRLSAANALLLAASHSASRRGVEFVARQTMDQTAVPMSPWLTQALASAAQSAGIQPTPMVSGAGHDAMVLAEAIPSCMLFLRSPGGISHHPDEAVLPHDVEAALATGIAFLQLLAQHHPHLRHTL